MSSGLTCHLLVGRSDASFTSRHPSEDIDNHNLHAIDEVVKKIYGVCGLDFFSTELAITFIEGSSAASGVNSRGKRKLVVIDYVMKCAICD